MSLEVGQKLRDARISRGVELSEVEQETKIRAKYLRAMEEDRWELLPGEPYTRGFLVSYAEFLDLDPEPLVATYRSEHPPVEEAAPIPETMLPQRGLGGGTLRSPGGWWVLGAIVAALIAIAAAFALTGGSEETGRHDGRSATGSARSPATTSTNPQGPTRPARIALELRSTGTVWVCLVDNRGRALIDGETLTPDEQRGPFRARGFRATFGNGAIAMTVDDRPVAIPDLGEPLGYSISPKGVARLGGSSRPTCV